MSTRSVITLKNKDETPISIYKQNNGFPEYMMPLLKEILNKIDFWRHTDQMSSIILYYLMEETVNDIRKNYPDMQEYLGYAIWANYEPTPDDMIAYHYIITPETISCYELGEKPELIQEETIN